MAAKKYNLNIAEFDNLVETYVQSFGDKYSSSKVELKGRIEYRFQEKTLGKDIATLACYNSLGRTSFLINGKKPDVAQKCAEFLIQNAEIAIPELKTFTIRPADDEEVDIILDFLKESKCNIEDQRTSTPVKRLVKIQGEYRDVVTLTHYNTGTLMVQGRPSMTFLNFIDIATEIFNPAEVKREHIRSYDIDTETNVIDSDLSKHLPHAYSKIGPKLDAIMAPSLILLNSPKEISDYTPYAFPVLRGAEGILKKIFSDEGIEINDGFKEYFRERKGEIEWAKDCSGLFPNEHLRKSLLDLYEFYKRERHTLFHVDATIDTSRTLKYNEALEIVIKGLKFIDEVYTYLK